MTQQHLPIWYLGKIESDVCDNALTDFETLPIKDASMGVNGEITEHSTRNTNVRFAEPNNWFGGLMFEHAMRANIDCGWDYHITGHENVQFAEYGPNQHYGWHTDTFTLSGNPLDRKVSVVCLLNDPTEFEGGAFVMRLYSEYFPDLVKGSIIAFPSILEHQVIPVTSGIRKSATIWTYGPRFK